MRVILTGFQPFAEHLSNISWQVAKSMVGENSIADPWAVQREAKLADLQVHIDSIELTVDLEGSKYISQQLISSQNYDAIIHIGLAEKSLLPRIETRAKDILDMRIEDNSGRKITGSEISGKGDLYCTIEQKYWNLDKFSKQLIFSDDAGEYVCNETLYRTLETIQELQLKDRYNRQLPCFFLHLPLEENYSLVDCCTVVKDCIAHMLFQPVVEVAAALIEIEDSFLIAKRNQSSVFSGKWEFPGGKLESGETSFKAIEREIKEELNLEVKALDKVGTWHHQLSDKEICLHLIKCGYGGTIDILSTEDFTAHSQLMWHPKDRMLELDWVGSDREIALFLQK